MEQVTLENYQELAMRTAKPLGFKMNLIHAALGIMSEIGEFVMETATDEPEEVSEPKMQKEMGDLFWFTALMCQTLNWDISSLEEVELTERVARLANNTQRAHVGNVCSNWLLCCGELQTVVKRIAVYKKEMTPELHGVLLQQTANIFAIAGAFCEYLKWDINEVLAMNIDKLQNKETGRYKDGVYSDAAALERNDEK